MPGNGTIKGGERPVVAIRKGKKVMATAYAGYWRIKKGEEISATDNLRLLVAG
jgi:hypothetical protein